MMLRPHSDDFAIELIYGVPSGNSATTEMIIHSNQGVRINSGTELQKEVRITIVGEWERDQLHEIFKGDGWQKSASRTRWYLENQLEVVKQLAPDPDVD